MPNRDDAANAMFGHPYGSLSVWGKRMVDDALEQTEKVFVPRNAALDRTPDLMRENEKLASENEQVRLENLELWEENTELKNELEELRNEYEALYRDRRSGRRQDRPGEPVTE